MSAPAAKRKTPATAAPAAKTVIVKKPKPGIAIRKAAGDAKWFDLYISQTKHFKMLMASVKELLTDVILDFRPDGFNMQSMDSAHIGMAHLFLTRSFFSPKHAYKCPQATSICASLPAFTKILNVAHDSDMIRLYVDHSDPDELCIDFISATRTSNWKMSLFDFEDDKMQIPRQNYGWIVKMRSAEFQRLIRELKIINDDNMKMIVAPTQCTFLLKGTLTNGKIVCVNDTSGLLEYKDDEKALILAGDEELDGDLNATLTQIVYDQTYAFDEQGQRVDTLDLTLSMRYMEFFSKTKSLSAYVTISIRSDMPVLIEYDLDHLGNQKHEEPFGYAEEEKKSGLDFDLDEVDRRHSWLRFYLAPKIEDVV